MAQFSPDALLVLTGPGGAIRFKAWEIPEFVEFGGPFRYIIHKFPGGTRQIDSLGPDDAPITWTGLMLTADGDTRAAQLWAMWEAGDKCIVSFGIWDFPVVISDLKFRYRANNYVEYKIELTRVIDAPEAFQAIAPPNDLNNAANVIPLPPVPPG